MARIRTVKPEHWSDKELPNIPMQAHLLWIGTWNFSDDEGIFENDPILIKSQIFPRRTDVRVEQVSQWLDQLVKARFIIPFVHNNVSYYIHRTFKTHQKIDKPQKSKIPMNVIRGMFDECSTNVQPCNVEESNVKESSVGGPPATAPKVFSRNVFKPPLLQDVKDYFLKTVGDSKKGNAWPPDKCANEAGQFLDHYTANGWVQSRGKPIKDWEAACRNWIRNELKGSFSPPRSEPAAAKQPAGIPPLESKPQLSKVQIDINYLYERFLEDESHVTIISTETFQYDLLKKSGMINFSEEQVKTIKDLSTKKCNGNADDKILMNTMKRFGVIEFFKQQKKKGSATVFSV